VTDGTPESGMDREIYVVCGEAGEPLRAFAELRPAKRLRDHWRNGEPTIRATVKPVDFAEDCDVDTGTDAGGDGA